jgi:hypothetical protein
MVVLIEDKVSGDEAVEEGCAVGLVVLACVVALSDDHGDELGTSLQVGAGLAG